MAPVLAGGLLECNLSHLRSVAVLCILDKIRSNPMHPLCGHCCAFCSSAGYTWCVGRSSVFLCTTFCRTSQYRKTFIPRSVALWNDSVGLAGFNCRVNAFYCPVLPLLFSSSTAITSYFLLLCSETLVSDMRHVSEVLVPGFCRPVLLCRGQDASGTWDGCLRSRWLRSISPTQI